MRGVAAVGANLPTQENMDCTPTPGATSVLIVNGTADPINPYEGGKVTLFGFGDRGRVLSARESAAYFARRNGIADPPTTEAIAQSEGSGPTSAERAVWRSAAGAEVRLYTIRNGGHTMPHPHVRFPRIPRPHASRAERTCGDLGLLRGAARALGGRPAGERAYLQRSLRGRRRNRQTPAVF
ncbi:MAG: hypothetical protein ABR499_19500 [Gemmatimonadaceae bacterium]